MRLSHQITLLISFVMFLMLMATVYISIHGSRQYLLEQMRLDGQHAGRTLANEISPVLSAGERSLAEAMLNSVFNRGTYQRIQIRALDGKVLFERHVPVVVRGVPTWFMALIAVEVPTVTSPVVDGVTRIATVEMSPQPGNAYRVLWKMTLSNLTWVIALAVIGVILLGLIIASALRPLTQVKRQADAIARQNYSLQTKLPFARELRQLVVAMNDMAEKLEHAMVAQLDHVIELSNQVRTDAGSGLLNREGFDERLHRALKQDINLQGQLLIIRIRGLERLNQFFSFKRGNEELHKIISKLKQLSANQWDMARLAGADLVVFIPDVSDHDLEQRCTELLKTLNAVSEDLQCVIGGISITAGHDRESLLKQANQALQQAVEANDRVECQSPKLRSSGL